MIGKPTIRGLRITVDQISKALAVEVDIDELLEDYPELEGKILKLLCFMQQSWQKKKEYLK